MRLYPVMTIEGQSFKGVKKHVVPNQSMTLHEIIRRFIKREALPVSHEGTYEDRYDYDLEKLANEDLTVKDEVLQEFRALAKKLDAQVKSEHISQQEKMRIAKEAEYQSMLKDLQSQITKPQTAKESIV